MKLKRVAAAAAIALASPAFALSTDLGMLGSSPEGFGNFFGTATGVFSDTFTFSLASAMTVSGMSGWSGIGTFGLVLLDGDGNTVGSDTTPSSFSFSLGAGSYALNFVGFGAAAGAVYGGNVSAVPEAETYAMMLAGLGMIGFMAARRQSRG